MTHLTTKINHWILNQNIVAFHGTSLEALNEILRSGQFNVSTDFAVIKSRLKPLLIQNERKGLDSQLIYDQDITLIGAYSLSKSKARSKAFHDFLYYTSGLSDILDAYDKDHDDMFDENGLLNESNKKNLTEIGIKLGHQSDEVQQKIHLGLKRKGAIIGIHADFFTGKTLNDFVFSEFYFFMGYSDSKRKGIETKFIGSIYIPTQREKRELLAFTEN